MPSIKERYCLLKVLEGTSIQLANIRSLLSSQVYIEIDNTFIVSISSTFKATIVSALKKDGTNYILVYVNLKTGCDVSAFGITAADKSKIKDIVLDV